jgi:hypothetical protein
MKTHLFYKIYKGWVATVFYVASTHLAHPDLGSHTDVHALQSFGGCTSYPHLFKAKILYLEDIC